MIFFNIGDNIQSKIKIPVISWAYMYVLFLQCKFK